MIALRWTRRARLDLESIQAFIARDSRHFAVVVVARILAATERLCAYPESGRVVPEVGRHDVREVIHGLYRIVYRLVSRDEIHVLTVHHAARRFPDSL